MLLGLGASERYTVATVDRREASLVDTYLTIDPRSLGLFRIVFGVVLLLDLYWRFLGIDFWYTNAGLIPNHTLLWSPPDHRRLSFFYMLSTHAEARAGMIVCALAFFAFLLGWHTKAAHIVSFVCLESLDARIPQLGNGGDVILNLLCLWTLFLPLGRRFSLDSLRVSLHARNERGVEHLADRGAMAGEDAPVRSLAVFALLLQFFVIYSFNVVHKTGASWSDGTAVHLVLHADRMVTPIGVWLRDLPVGVLRFLTHATLFTEAVGALLIISPIAPRITRLIAILVLPLMHAAFAACLDIGAFSYAMISFYVLLLHRTHWQTLAGWAARRRPERIVFFDASSGICFQFARVLARLDRAGRIRFLSSDAANLPEGLDPTLAKRSMLVRDGATGEVFTGIRGVAELARALPCGGAAWVLLRLPGISALANVTCEAVAHDREKLSSWFGYPGCEVGASVATRAPSPPATGLRRAQTRVVRGAREGLCAIVMLATITEASRASAAIPEALKLPQAEFLQGVIEYACLYQGWRMFAPDPAVEDVNVSVEAWTVDGRMVDPYNAVASRQKTPPFEAIPTRLGQDQFFSVYSIFIPEPEYAAYRGAFAVWVLAYHERTGRPNDRIVHFTAYKLSDRSPPLGGSQPTNVRKEPFMSFPQ